MVQSQRAPDVDHVCVRLRPLGIGVCIEKVPTKVIALIETALGIEKAL